MNGLLLFLTITGSFFLVLSLIRRFSWAGFNSLSESLQGNVHHVLFVILAVAWFLGLGLRDLITGWAFYLDIVSLDMLWVTGGIGLIGWLSIIPWMGGFVREYKQTDAFGFFKAPELITLGLVLFFGCAHVHRAIVPWFDHDEIAVYGFLSKLIGQGVTFQDFGVIDGRTSGLMESRDASSVRVMQDAFGALYSMVVVRLSRLLGLGFCALLIYGFLRIVSVSRLWALLCAAAFLSVPELLVYIGTSLKLDSVIMGYELSAVLVFSFVIVLLVKKRNIESLRGKEGLIGIAVCLSFLSVASRPSGIYCAFFIGSLGSLILLRTLPSSGKKVAAFLLIAVVGVLCSAKYIHAYQIWGNPLYPFKGPWPLNGGDYENWLIWLRDNINVLGLPPVIKQIYLIFSLAVGIETRDLNKWFSPEIVAIIPIAKLRACGMFWLSPALLTIFVAPFFWRRISGVAVLSGIFIYLFILWSNGVHYSRVFLAAGTLPILLAGMIASYPQAKLPQFTRYIQMAVKGGLWVTVLVMIPVYWFRILPEFPHSIQALYDAEARYSSNAKRLGQAYGDDNLPTQNEAVAISNLISDKEKVVLAITFSGRVIHILFTSGEFSDYDSVKAVDGNWWHGFDYVLLNREFEIAPGQHVFLERNFGTVLFESQDRQWVLLGRD